MIGVALAAIIIGIVFLFVPLIGIPIGILGLVLLAVRLTAGRRVGAAEPRT